MNIISSGRAHAEYWQRVLYALHILHGLRLKMRTKDMYSDYVKQMFTMQIWCSVNLCVMDLCVMHTS